MRCRPVLAIAFVVAGCMTVREAGPAPADLSVARRWASNADGYVFTVGYFTPEQERSPAWEAARIASAATLRFCSNKEIVRRDVRWFEPIAPGEPQCAAIVYSFACTPRRPEWGSSLEYQRRQAYFEGLDSPIETGCGEKDGTRRPRSGIPRASGVVLSATTEFCRDALPDIAIGSFQLRDANYVQERTLLSDHYMRHGRPYSGSPARFLGLAATAGRRLHFVITTRELPHDRHNIFVDQVFSDNGEGYCVTLTARQGSALWRRTIRRDSFPGVDWDMVDPNAHSTNPDAYWDAYTDSHLLQHQLALHLGLDIPDDHPPEAVIGNSLPQESEAERSRNGD